VNGGERVSCDPATFSQVPALGRLRAVTEKDARGTPTIPVSHPGFLLSCGFGALGLLLILVGLVIGGEIIFVIGTFLGALSMFAALAWRADLVAAWKRDKPIR
jgi:hypothetical protein